MHGSIERRAYGTTAAGEPVVEFTMKARDGIEARIISFGATLVRLRVPDRDGRPDHVVLGYPDLAGYETGDTYFGATVGRYANRIARARFDLEGETHRLSANEGENHLHGGHLGFGKRVWRVADMGTDAAEGVLFSYTSPAGEEGYPGTVDVSVRYCLPAPDELRIDYLAVTDAATVVNPTHHSYLNLAGEGSGTVDDHRLTIFAQRFTPVDRQLIPTGELAPVQGTPFDFRAPRPIGAAHASMHHQLRIAGGYDHNFVLDAPPGGLPALAARLEAPSSGRTLELWTTEPGLQFYGGGQLDGSVRGTTGVPYGRGHGLALEPQHFPDSPNRADFPSTVLRPGGTFRSTTRFRFGTGAARD